MTDQWEKLAGDPGIFALRMAFAPDPDGGYGVSSEISLSWGSFQIWVEGRNLCAHLEEGERMDSVHWYLLPLIEWFALNWNPLLHEERLPVRNDDDTAWTSLRATRFPPPAVENDEEKASKWGTTWQNWWARHAIRMASEGGLFPDVILRRFRDSVEVSWGPAPTAGMPQHFSFLKSEKGAARLTPRQVAEPLHDVMFSASEYLLSLKPDAHRIEALCEALRMLKSAVDPGPRLMWLAGLGVDEHSVWMGWQRARRLLDKVAEDARRAMLDVLQAPLVIDGSCHAALMFGSLAPDVTEEDIEHIALKMVSLYSPEGESETTRAMCRSAPVEESHSRPWSQGYELAEKLHKELYQRFAMRFVKDDSVDIHEMVDHLEITVGDIALSDDKIRGISVVGPQHRAGIFVNSRHSANAHAFGNRFTLAHELCHVLFDREAGSRLAIASGPWAPRDVERRANAFAAMLLMPYDLVRRAVSTITTRLDTKDGIRQVASRLQTGFLPALHHLANLEFIDAAAHQRLKNDVPDGIKEIRSWADLDDWMQLTQS